VTGNTTDKLFAYCKKIVVFYLQCCIMAFKLRQLIKAGVKAMLSVLATKYSQEAKADICLIKKNGKYSVVLKEWIEKKIPHTNFLWTSSKSKAMTSKPDPKAKHPFKGWVHFK
jgi:hypothetical protein